MRARLITAGLFVPFLFVAFAGFSGVRACAGLRLEELDPLEEHPAVWTPEVTEDVFSVPELPSGGLDVDLSPFHREFDRDGIVRIFVGYGYQAYTRTRVQRLFEMLRVLLEPQGISEFQLSSDGRLITFTGKARSPRYEIRIGVERNEFISALAENEIILYTGHSRYGRGPAFESFTNCFRMGESFDAVEVDARNSYFLSEPTLFTGLFPLYQAWVDGLAISYQYRGQRNPTSYLTPDSYTRNIPAGDVDLAKAAFLPGKQVLFFHSCKNERYWRRTLRNRLPDPAEKMIFGTWRDSLGGLRPDAAFIASLVLRTPGSAAVVEALNSTKDCDACFTNY